MPVELLQPASLPVVPLYRQVAVATGSRLVFVAGQVAVGADDRVVAPGDLAAQVEQCYLNVATALSAAGATFADVAKVTCYLVDWRPDKYGAIVEGISRASERLGIDVPVPPFTGIGVAALAAPDLIVEVEAMAVLS